MKIQSSTIYQGSPTQFHYIYKGSGFEDLYRQSIEDGFAEKQKQSNFFAPWQTSPCFLEGSRSRGGIGFIELSEEDKVKIREFMEIANANEEARKVRDAEAALLRKTHKFIPEQPKEPPKIKTKPILVQKVWMNGREITFNFPSSEKKSLDQVNSPKSLKQPAYKREVCGVINRHSFVSRGKITTADGKKRNFDFYMENGKISDAPICSEGPRPNGRAPLIVELNGEAPKLSRDTMAFDMNSDGRKENIRLLASGSGFLVLDKNQDGKINDGTEILGAGIGEDGFATLGKYDGDDNGWIDESDEIFNELRVWENTGEGNMRLVTLKEAGIGAIYLDAAMNDVDLWQTRSGGKDTIKTSSVVLREDFSIGGIHTLSTWGLDPLNLFTEAEDV